jgi:hypothetical protein
MLRFLEEDNDYNEYCNNLLQLLLGSSRIILDKQMLMANKKFGRVSNMR